MYYFIKIETQLEKTTISEFSSPVTMNFSAECMDFQELVVGPYNLWELL